MKFYKMRKILVVLLALLPFSMVHSQLLWRISGGGLSEPSYMLGTFHLAPGTIVDSIAGFHDAFDHIRQVCGEVVTEEMLKAENLQRVQEAMFLPEGVTIQSLLSKEEMNALNQFTMDLMGVDFSNPLVGGQLSRLIPAALNTDFSVMMYKKHNPQFTPNNGIDNYVQQLGKEKGYAAVGLESLDDQIEVLFKSQTIERQKELLMCMVKHRDYMEMFTEKLVKAYYAQDLSSIEALGDERLNDGCDNTDEENEILIDNRNLRWVKAMPGIMQTPTLFAVGAAHLIGEKGLVALLREAGYEVTAVAQTP